MQCTNYLKAAGLRLCLLLNVGRPRLVFGALNAFCAAAPQPPP